MKCKIHDETLQHIVDSNDNIACWCESCEKEYPTFLKTKEFKPSDIPGLITWVKDGKLVSKL